MPSQKNCFCMEDMFDEALPTSLAVVVNVGFSSKFCFCVEDILLLDKALSTTLVVIDVRLSGINILLLSNMPGKKFCEGTFCGFVVWFFCLADLDY